MSYEPGGMCRSHWSNKNPISCDHNCGDHKKQKIRTKEKSQSPVDMAMAERNEARLEKEEAIRIRAIRAVEICVSVYHSAIARDATLLTSLIAEVYKDLKEIDEDDQL